MRTFIAIELDNEIKNNLSSFVSKLDKLAKGSRHIRWVKPEGMHLTLKFLVEITGEKVEEVENILKAVSEKHKPFALKFKGTGSFPPASRNPRVLWVGIEEVETLKALQFHLEGELEKLDFPREKRKFHPHLTLGRVKIPTQLEEAISQLEKSKESSFGEMQVNKLTFFQSILKPTGAEYSVLYESELK
ncbi:MAG: RNA 2',3'-cyclic phosphodiesterase [Candidatus Aminicenantes bacterium]|nr:MAG: RNA 2',3'-cyclic phosphodiesterase [Candidatus Aminicenantes bacterium]